MDDLSIKVDEAPAMLARLVDQLLAMPVDFSDIPVLPDEVDPESLKLLESTARAAQQGDTGSAFRMINRVRGRSFEFDYLKGKILFAHKCFYEASKFFNEALSRFEDYGELWFLSGLVNYQMGVMGQAFMEWHEAFRANKNHQDAKLLVSLANTMMTKTNREYNPEAEPMAPLVSGRGIDVGCGAAKTSPEAIGVDLIAPGKTGDEASQKGRVSQADVQASGDDLWMFSDGELDYVIARHNLEHYVDPVRTLREWARVLKEGGVLGLVLPDDEAFDTLKADSTHKHAYTQSSLRNLLSLIPDLAIVEQGICQNRWSVYVILEKVTPGASPAYPYRRRLNERIAKDVLKRAELSLMMGMSDVAAAALRKASELVPEKDLPANPDSLHPYPFPDEPPSYEVKNHGGLRIALSNGHARWEDWRTALEGMGNTVYETPIDGAGKINWIAERRLREFGPGLFASSVYNPGMAEKLALMGIPYVCWETETPTRNIHWRRGFVEDNTTLFHPSRDEVERLRGMGAGFVHHLPLAADDSALKSVDGRGKRNLDICYMDDGDGADFYPEFLLSLKKKLMSSDVQDEDKNDIFRWIRTLTVLIEKSARPYGEWKMPDLLGGNKAMADNPGALGLSVDDIQRIVGDEITARWRAAVIGALAGIEVNIWGASRWKAMTVNGTEYRGPAPDACEAGSIYASCKINIYTGRTYQRDVAPQRVFDVLASGGFLMMDKNEAVDELFTAGEDYISFTDPKNAREMAEYYLENDEERKAIARSGQRKVMENHTLKDRWKTILETFGSRAL